MTEMKKGYSVEFVERTKKLITEREIYDAAKKSDGEVTLLMNCLLGLVVFVSEKEGGVNAFSRRFNGNENHGFLFVERNEAIELAESFCIGKAVAVERFNSIGRRKDLLRLMRNGIAHQNIEPEFIDEEWSGVYIWNVSMRKPNKNKINFFVYFTVDQLREFALRIADEYLQWKNPPSAPERESTTY